MRREVYCHEALKPSAGKKTTVNNTNEKKVDTRTHSATSAHAAIHG
jgi:hypothetical protein